MTLRAIVINLLVFFVACCGFVACYGPTGPAGNSGSSGTPGAPGPTGPAGALGCDGLAAGETAGVNVTLTLSTPQNGSFFAGGERADLTIQFTNRCGSTLHAADLGTANLYLSGPRLGTTTRTAVKLLNCITDRNAADRQHHMINLRAPNFAQPGENNFSEASDGTIMFHLGAISDETPGTYSVGVWAKSQDDRDQSLVTAEMQIGTEQREEYASGPSASSTCYACHLGALSGKSYQAHIIPGFSPFGNYAIDQTPIANCQLCHNLDGYSANPTVRKVHGAHRGMNQKSPGVAHPEYGLGQDPTLAEFMDVVFPSMPGAELDCTKCHADDRWKTRPSRLGCGTCHDNVFFDTGTLVPPRDFGAPSSGPCSTDASCASFGWLATCNISTGHCQRTSHPIQLDEAQCAVCHPADSFSIAPVAARHEILAVTRVPGLQMIQPTLSGGSGPNGTFELGDVPLLKFRLADRAGTIITDLIANSAYSGTATIAGPTDDRQRVLGPLDMKSTGTLTLDTSTNLYTYVFPSGLPAQALTPFNARAPFSRVNGPGTYTLWAYLNKEVTVGDQSFFDAANAVLDFKFGADLPIRPRQVISRSACNACHVNIQFHSGTWAPLRAAQQAAEACSVCHTKGSFDPTVGARGLPCATSADCGGFTGGWETCQDTNGDGIPDTCVITVDPTPSQTLDFGPMVHDLHYARLRGGYAERQNLISPPDLVLIGDGNSVDDMQFALFPQDIRNCTKCHVDTRGTCSAAAPCGVGQACVGGTCMNDSWLVPSMRVCTSCHDDVQTFGHAALMTYSNAGQPIETCSVCHGRDAAFAIDKVHQIAAPYQPPYPREKQ